MSGDYNKVQTVFQVFLQPGTYSVRLMEDEMRDERGDKSLKLEWHVKEITYIVHSLWISMTSAE